MNALETRQKRPPILRFRDWIWLSVYAAAIYAPFGSCKEVERQEAEHLKTLPPGTEWTGHGVLFGDQVASSLMNWAFFAMLLFGFVALARFVKLLAVDPKGNSTTTVIRSLFHTALCGVAAMAMLSTLAILVFAAD